MAKRGPVLDQLNLVVCDFDAAAAFYRRLGLEVPESPESFDIRHADIAFPSGFSLDLDNEKLASVYNAAWRRPGPRTRVVIGFRFETREEVDAKYAELTAAGHPGRQVPYDTFWGARYAVVADPDGNDVGLMSPPEAERRSWPPKSSPDA
ncbi:MAG TPA: VOC family protein [Myxococcota bacterium]|nr:VOC family protein [Myxococcota bacterium]